MQEVRMIILSAGYFFSVLASAQADEITDRVQQALKFYGEKKYPEAITDMNAAVTEIQRLANAGVYAVLPDAWGDWVNQKELDEEFPSVMFGGGSIVNKGYLNSSTRGRINVSVVSKSPIVASAVMSLNNPAAYASASNIEVVQVDGRDAIHERIGAGLEKLTVIISNQAILILEGNGLQQSDNLMEFAKAIDIKKIQDAL